MEPRRDDGDDGGVGHDVDRESEIAAMEPRRDDGDDGSKNSGRLTSNVTPSRESCRRAMRSHPLF